MLRGVCLLQYLYTCKRNIKTKLYLWTFSELVIGVITMRTEEQIDANFVTHPSIVSWTIHNVDLGHNRKGFKNSMKFSITDNWGGVYLPTTKVKRGYKLFKNDFKKG